MSHKISVNGQRDNGTMEGWTAGHRNTMCLRHLLADSQVCIITRIPYCLFECYIHHVVAVNIPPKMAASSVISVKLSVWTVYGCKYIVIMVVST